ncbi:hypothetical protein [Streptomyces sp.]|nr:hypothetical protein [Streptomyces sp.]
MRTKPCKWCGQPVGYRSWWRSRRYCNRWHQTRKWISRILELFGEAASA